MFPLSKLVYSALPISKKLAHRIEGKIMRLVLKNKNFTIISNNCWGGGIYEDLDIPYQSPTVGLFFYAPCYIKFVSDLKGYLNLDFTEFVTDSAYPEANEFRKNHNWFYPIGILGDIEVHFMHFKTAEECITKWNRRKTRINWDQLYVKMCDRDLCNSEIRDQFLALPFPKKVFFGSQSLKKIDYIYLESYSGQPFVGSLYEEPWNYRKYFNLVKWLS